MVESSKGRRPMDLRPFWRCEKRVYDVMSSESDEVKLKRELNGYPRAGNIPCSFPKSAFRFDYAHT